MAMVMRVVFPAPFSSKRLNKGSHTRLSELPEFIDMIPKKGPLHELIPSDKAQSNTLIVIYSSRFFLKYAANLSSGFRL